MSHSFYARKLTIYASQDSAFIVLTIVDLIWFEDSLKAEGFLVTLYEIR